MRSAEPIRFGTAVSQNCSGSDSVIPTLPRLITTIVHSTQTLKPMCSANTERNRFFRAIWLRAVETEPGGSRTDLPAMARPRANIDTAALADAFAPDGLHGTSSA